MGKQVEVTYECDATNCGNSMTDEAEVFEIEVRITSPGNPGVTRLNAVLDGNHSDDFENTLRDDYGFRSPHGN